jgi:hypothetical protein
VELNKKINELKFKYDKDIELISNELKNKQEELSSLTKVSYIQSLNKQLGEKTNYCHILELQLDKLRRENNIPVVPNPIIEKLAKKAAEAESELKAQKEQSENAKLNVGKKSKKQIIVEQSTIKQVNEILEENSVTLNNCEKTVDVDVDVDIVEVEPENISSKKIKKNKKKAIVDDNIDENITEEDVIIDEIKPEPVENKKKKKAKNQSVIEENSIEETVNECDKFEKFDPEKFEDLNGYELLLYKTNYYLRDLETSELYDINIDENKPGKVVGLINGKGKVKLN